MKSLCFWLVVGIASATMTLFSLRPANALQFWISKAGEETPLTTLIVAPGEEFSISVWVQHERPLNAILVLLGYDRTDRIGFAASPVLNKIQGVLANVVPIAGFTGAVHKGGGRGSGSRPYGYSILQAHVTGSVTPTPAIRFADVTLKNVGLMPGDSPLDVVIWDAGVGGSWTTMAMEPPDKPVRPLSGTQGNAFTLTLVPVPEPGSLLALATGVVGLAGVALRRRRA